MKENAIAKLNEYKKLVRDYISKRDWFMADYYAKRIEELERKEEDKKRELRKTKERKNLTINI